MSNIDKSSIESRRDQSRKYAPRVPSGPRPRTPAGNKISRLYAMRHGLSSQTVVSSKNNSSHIGVSVQTPEIHFALATAKSYRHPAQTLRRSVCTSSAHPASPTGPSSSSVNLQAPCEEEHWQTIEATRAYKMHDEATNEPASPYLATEDGFVFANKGIESFIRCEQRQKGARSHECSGEIGPATGTVKYAGPQGTYVGLDQVDVLLPNSLAGSGRLVLTGTVDGQTTRLPLPRASRHIF